MKAVALISDQTFHLDHLIPICDLLKAPLLTANEEVYDCAKKYYPADLDIHLKTSLEISPDFLVKHYDLILHPYFWPKEVTDKHFLQAEKIHNKKMRFLYVPHGNSDKGWHRYWMENYASVDTAMIYGDHMKTFLEAKDALPKHIVMGNLRLQYYESRKSFFDLFCKNKLDLKLDLKKKTLLYAPTWADDENSCSLFDSIEQLLNSLLPTWNVIVKLHPLVREKQPGEIEMLLGKIEDKGNLTIIEEAPFIYPLFSFTDAFLGDHSSVGYDYLSTGKPLFFLNPAHRSSNDPGRFLHQCGQTLLSEEEALKYLESEDLFEKRREGLYNYAFSSIEAEDVKKEITALFRGEEEHRPSANH